MNSFLWDIVSNDGVDNDLTRYTRNFFSQHLNLDELITILKLKEKYISISRLIKERFKPNEVEFPHFDYLLFLPTKSIFEFIPFQHGEEFFFIIHIPNQTPDHI